MRQLIRMDDFPHGDKNLYRKQMECYRNEVWDIMEIFERHRVDFIWGVSPLLCEDKHFEVLKDIRHGRVVMHGFSHAFHQVDNWDTVTDCWREGGEFKGMTRETIAEQYDQCNRILNRFATYDPRHFIPPFNCYNQELLDVLSTRGVEWIHTCDQEWNKFQLGKLDHKGITPVVATLFNSYDFASSVLTRLDDLETQITLHWIYDVQRGGWREYYERLAAKVAS